GTREKTMACSRRSPGRRKWRPRGEPPPRAVPRLPPDRGKAGETWRPIAAERLGGDWRAASLAAWNGRDAAEPPASGMLIKIPPLSALEGDGRERLPRTDRHHGGGHRGGPRPGPSLGRAGHRPGSGAAGLPRADANGLPAEGPPGEGVVRARQPRRARARRADRAGDRDRGGL